MASPHRLVTLVSDTTIVGYSQFLESINTADQQPNITLTPNPATQAIYINAEGTTGPVQVEIVDLTGRTLDQFQQQRGSPHVHSITHLPQGAYFVRFRTPTQTTIKKLIVR